jgi:hypothetical protein
MPYIGDLDKDKLNMEIIKAAESEEGNTVTARVFYKA